MKKGLIALLIGAVLVCQGFAKPKVEEYKFDFSKDFYPGIAYVYSNSKVFRGSVLKKADILKNEYIIEKVNCSAALVPITLTLNVKVEKDGTIVYDYSNLVYVKDKKQAAMSNLVAVNTITDAFNTLLPQVFNDEAKYNQSKSEWFTSAGLLFAMADGLTEIRAAKFSEMVKDAPVNLEAKVFEAKMNDTGDFSDYQYRISASVYIDTLNHVSFVYYTNDDDKAGSAQGDKITIKGTIKEFKKYSFLNSLSFVVIDE